jgi:hypothetical protein
LDRISRPGELASRDRDRGISEHVKAKLPTKLPIVVTSPAFNAAVRKDRTGVLATNGNLFSVIDS